MKIIRVKSIFNDMITFLHATVLCYTNGTLDRFTKMKLVNFLKRPENNSKAIMRKSVLFLTLLSIFGASFAGDDAGHFAVGGGFSDISQEHLDSSMPEVYNVFGLFKYKYPEFDYILKRVVSGKHQVVAGSHTIYQIEVGPRDHADQTHACEIDMYRSLGDVINKVSMDCNDGKKFVYEK